VGDPEALEAALVEPRGRRPRPRVAAERRPGGHRRELALEAHTREALGRALEGRGGSPTKGGSRARSVACVEPDDDGVLAIAHRARGFGPAVQRAGTNVGGNTDREQDGEGGESKRRAHEVSYEKEKTTEFAPRGTRSSGDGSRGSLRAAMIVGCRMPSDKGVCDEPEVVDTPQGRPYTAALILPHPAPPASGRSPHIHGGVPHWRPG
jgi:hypothetical protein